MMQPKGSWLRFAWVVVLLGSVGLFLQARNAPEDVPAHRPLALLPERLGDWVGTDMGIPGDALAVLGPGEFLERNYERPADEPPIDLFLAYFPSQRTGDTVHSPRNCLPGSGWTPVQSSRMLLGVPGGANITVNRYLIAKAADRMLVLYWYQAHGRAVASEYWAKFYLVADAIRLNRTDGALVRIVTPVAHGESLDNAEDRAAGFARGILPLLDEYIPR